MADLQGAALARYTSYTNADAQVDHNRGWHWAISTGLVPPPNHHLDRVMHDVDFEARAVIGRVNLMREQEGGSVSEQLQPALRRFNQDLPVKRDDIHRRFEARLSQVDREFSNEQEALEREQRDLDEQRDAMRERIGVRPLRTSFDKKIGYKGYGIDQYSGALGLLSIAEVPINRLAFDLFFAAEPIVAIVVAAGLGVMLILFCHFIGLNLRRSTTDKPWELTARLGSCVLFFSLCTVIVVILTKFREIVVAAQRAGSEPPDFARLIGEGKLRIPDIKEFVLNFQLDGMGQALFALNFAILMLGILLAFLRHDPDQDYELIEKRQKVLDAEKLELKRRYERERHHLVEVQTRALDGNAQELRDAGRRVEELQAKRNAIDARFDRLCNMAEAFANKRKTNFYQGYLAAIAHHLQNNSRFRADGPIFESGPAPNVQSHGEH